MPYVLLSTVGRRGDSAVLLSTSEYGGEERRQCRTSEYF